MMAEDLRGFMIEYVDWGWVLTSGLVSYRGGGRWARRWCLLLVDLGGGTGDEWPKNILSLKAWICLHTARHYLTI